MRAFLLLTAAIVASIAIGVAALSSSPISRAVGRSAISDCASSSQLFQYAFASAISGLQPSVQGQVSYECFETTRSADLSAADAEPVSPSLGAEKVTAVALTFDHVVTEEEFAPATGYPAPTGDYFTYDFDSSTGAILDFALGTFSAQYLLPGFRPHGAVTRGTASVDFDEFAVPSSEGFGGGLILYPRVSRNRLHGGVVVVPGLGGDAESMFWFGDLLASHGFVALLINTSSPEDRPFQRAAEISPAIAYLTKLSPVRGEVDKSRLGALGFSMGGGAVLEAGEKIPALRAVVALAPWDYYDLFNEVKVPTFIVGCQDDEIAPVSGNARPMYESLGPELQKKYLEVAGGSHSCAVLPSNLLSTNVVAWLARFVDGDLGANQVLCPPVPMSDAVSRSEGACPL